VAAAGEFRRHSLHSAQILTQVNTAAWLRLRICDQSRPSKAFVLDIAGSKCFSSLSPARIGYATSKARVKWQAQSGHGRASPRLHPRRLSRSFPYRVTPPRPASVGRASGEPQCADKSIGSTAPKERAPSGKDFQATVNLINTCDR